jgi:hypothetical protein
MNVRRNHEQMRPEEHHLQALGVWAKELPASAWKPGPPPQTDGVYFAVKTRTGRILTGRAKAFCPRHLRLVAELPKFGPVIAYVEAGD